MIQLTLQIDGLSSKITALHAQFGNLPRPSLSSTHQRVKAAMTNTTLTSHGYQSTQVVVFHGHLSLALFHCTPSIFQLPEKPCAMPLVLVLPDQPAVLLSHLLMIIRARSNTADVIYIISGLQTPFRSQHSHIFISTRTYLLVRVVWS